MQHHQFNLEILNILRSWTKRAHSGQKVSCFESHGYVHDASNCWDLFAQALISGRSIEAMLPAASMRGGTTPEGRVGHFFTLCLRELEVNHPEVKAYRLFGLKKGELMDNGQPAPHSAFERCLRKELVEEFRAIVTRKLGL